MKFRKVNRVFTPIKKYAWLLVLLIAGGGMFVPKLGLLLIPIMITLIGISLFRGKYWCGNLCPHASLFDFVMLPFAPLKKIPDFFKSVYWRGAFFLFFMAMFTRKLVNVIGFYGDYDFLDKLGTIFSFNYLLPTVIGITLGLFINPRTWCTFCPMGTMQALSYKFGKVLKINQKTDLKIVMHDQDKCRECGICAMVCPMQLAPYQEVDGNGVFNNEACIKCSVCVSSCPVKILALENPGQTVEDRFSKKSA